MTIPFEGFPKIPRLRRDCTITEKIDGTNAQVFIRLPDPVLPNWGFEIGIDTQIVIDGSPAIIRAGSRNRWLGQGGKQDNLGFGMWVTDHAHALASLGLGQHFGEWYGQGIQRGYGLDHKRFALFNTARWGKHNPNTPACCEVVPVLHTHAFGDFAVDSVLDHLRSVGSHAALGFASPEGIVVYMHASKTLHKVLLENDEVAKGQAAA